MKFRPVVLSMSLLLLAGCATHGYAPRVQQRYAVGDYLSRTTRRAVAPAVDYGYAATYAAAPTYVAAQAPAAVTTAASGHYGVATGTNPCAPCAPQSRTVYYDAGTATVDHVHRYREIHRHRMEVTAEDIGCVDCPQAR